MWKYINLLDQLKISTGGFFASVCVTLLHFAHVSKIPWLLGWGLFLISPPKSKDPRLLCFLYHQAYNNRKQHLCANVHTVQTINTASHNSQEQSAVPVLAPVQTATAGCCCSTLLQLARLSLTSGCAHSCSGALAAALGDTLGSDWHVYPLQTSGPSSALATWSCSSGSYSCSPACGLVSLEVCWPWQVHAHKTS